MEAPQNPAGSFAPEQDYCPERRAEFIAIIENAPAPLREAVAGLSDGQLDTRYRNWTVRQIANHIADSHINSYVRFRLALTEENPTIKPYDESRWSELPDAGTGSVNDSLALLEGLHGRWSRLLRAMSEEQFARTFFHPETGEAVSLNAALCYYAWHCRHHTAQITWLRQRNGW